MNLNQETACKTLRDLGSAEAAEWLMENYSFGRGNAGEAFVLMPHRSWSKPDQIKLANYYLSNLPHRSDRGYKALLTFMGLSNFLAVMVRHLPAGLGERTLLAYHLLPILNSHPHKARYQPLVSAFLNSLRDPQAAHSGDENPRRQTPKP